MLALGVPGCLRRHLPQRTGVAAWVGSPEPIELPQRDAGTASVALEGTVERLWFDGRRPVRLEERGGS